MSPSRSDQGLMIEQFEWTTASTARMAFTHRYEPIQPHLFLEFAREINADRVADVGANVGFYSLIVTTLPSVEHVVGFEPAPECFAAYKQNITLNGLTGVITPIEMAASDEIGKSGFTCLDGIPA